MGRRGWRASGARLLLSSRSARAPQQTNQELYFFLWVAATRLFMWFASLCRKFKNIFETAALSYLSQQDGMAAYCVQLCLVKGALRERLVKVHSTQPQEATEGAGKILMHVVEECTSSCNPGSTCFLSLGNSTAVPRAARY
jgi:hypothetical protein